MKPYWLTHLLTSALLVTGITSSREIRNLSPRATPLTTVQAADSNKVLITEVLFAPVSGDTSFVELANVGAAAVDLAGFFLRVDTLEIPLPALTAPLARGARVLIRFDGRGTVEDNVVHIGKNTGLRAEAGSVAVFTEDERLLDRVAWGTAVGAIMPPRGGMAPSRVEPGSTFGRPPGAERPGAPTDWVIYTREQVTPGMPNPLPAVVQLIPLNGAIFSTTTIDLSWYPVPGAARYRVQLATDTTFAEPLMNQLVDAPPLSSGQRASGTYWWRVQAIPAEGAPAAWSLPNRITLGGEDRDDALDNVGIGMSRSEPWSGPVLLNVPLIVQHKDSPMLLLESQQSGGIRTAGSMPNMPHNWDNDHQVLDQSDPADNMNCAIASMTMLNHFYGGDLTQDRIGYEMFSKNIDRYAATIQARAIEPPTLVPREKAPGPERDLNYGYGLTLEHIVAAGVFALGAVAGPGSGWASVDDVWKAVVSEIDAGRALLGFNCCHVFVIRGYELRNGERLLYINDPWSGPGMPGQYSINLDTSNPQLAHVHGFVSFPTPSAVGRLEPNFFTDADGDDVSDFDEINRFHTNANNPDTDADGVPDKKDIESGVYELEHTYGYAWNPAAGNPGRDFDNDGRPPELDPDSDNGGCKDGDEDTDRDGYHTLPETGNFDPTDDVCAGLQGVLSYRNEFWGSTQSISKRGVNVGVIQVRVKPEKPGSREHFVNDSSTFSYHSFGRLLIDYGQCVIWARGTARGGGAFLSPEGNIGIGVADDGTVAVEAYMSVPGTIQAGSDCGGFPGGQGWQQSGMGFPDCVGKRVEAPRASGVPVTYRFDCLNSGTLPDGSRYTMTAKGYLRLQ